MSIYRVLEDDENTRNAELEFEEASREEVNAKIQAEKERVNEIMEKERRKQEYKRLGLADKTKFGQGGMQMSG